MHFDLGYILNALKCIMDSIAVMCIRAGIDNDPFRSVAVGSLNPVDYGTLVIGLIELNLPRPP